VSGMVREMRMEHGTAANPASALTANDEARGCLTTAGPLTKTDHLEINHG